MASVGSYTADVMKAKNPIAAEADEAETFMRIGIDGVERRVTGLRPGMGEYETIRQYTSAAALKSGKIAALALKSTIATLTDSLGNSFDVFVKNVTVIREFRAIEASGPGSGDWVLYLSWSVETV